ncbi:MAG TPA: IS630 family transposase, partial [Steroidobacteraceae bacterium]|nr:IS630 family transposase [Steroidobacteraceae bacterium]
MNVCWRVDLNQEERDQLSQMLNGGTHAARRLKRAQILLAADAGESDAAIAANVSV